MGWSESYYRDWRDQGKREWRRKAADFLEAADDFFEGLGQEQDILDIDINRYTALWREVREMIERDLLE